MTDIHHVKIHPAIGVARVGNSGDYFIGPEVPDPPSQAAGSVKDAQGAIKRQAARFRVYGYDSAGNVVREITQDDTKKDSVSWRVHLANRKAAWYRFQVALDIPEAAKLTAAQRGRRNQMFPQRAELVIDAGAKSVTGKDVGAGNAVKCVGKIRKTQVYLGELRTDAAGRLLVLGGKGAAGLFVDDKDKDDPRFVLGSFGNNDGWYDDISDGPVTAEVKVDGKPVPVTGNAWVVVAPPNYAPDVKSVITLYDLVHDLFVRTETLARPTKVSFDRHIAPLLRRFTGLQWVNRGFAMEFGWGREHDFTSPAILRTLRGKDPEQRDERQQIYMMMRDYERDGMSPLPWPWIYGDAMETPAKSVRQHLTLTETQDWMLQQWVLGNHDETAYTPPTHLDDAPLAERPALLDRAALDHCLADAFHPGCEVTWPMRHELLYDEPFRIRHRAAANPEPDYGAALSTDRALSTHGPLDGQEPGGLTRWMSVPWQADTVSCRSGYESANNMGPRYSPYLPTFWPARVPNHVLKETDFAVVDDVTKTDDQRRTAFEHRAVWLRFMANKRPQSVKDMLAGWHKLGIVESRPYTGKDGKFPEFVLVESRPDLPEPKDDQTNLVNAHVPEAGHAAVDADREAITEQTAAEVAERTGFPREQISADYVAKVDPFQGRR